MVCVLLQNIVFTEKNTAPKKDDDKSVQNCVLACVSEWCARKRL